MKLLSSCRACTQITSLPVLLSLMWFPLCVDNLSLAKCKCMYCRVTNVLWLFGKITAYHLILNTTQECANVLFGCNTTTASLVGNAPLALQVVGKILNEKSVELVIKRLQTDRISTFSPADLPATDCFETSLNWFLTPENQKCARLINNFSQSFDETAAIAILNHTGNGCLKVFEPTQI